MTRPQGSSSLMLLLEPDEILAVRENLQSAAKMPDGPPSRRVPESLMAEIDRVLRLVELEVRKRRRIPPHG